MPPFGHLRMGPRQFASCIRSNFASLYIRTRCRWSQSWSSVDQSFDANLMITKASAKSLLLLFRYRFCLLHLSVIKASPLVMNDNTTCHFFKMIRHEPCLEYRRSLFGNQDFSSCYEVCRLRFKAQSKTVRLRYHTRNDHFCRGTRMVGNRDGAHGLRHLVVEHLSHRKIEILHQLLGERFPQH